MAGKRRYIPAMRCWSGWQVRLLIEYARIDGNLTSYSQSESYHFERILRNSDFPKVFHFSRLAFCIICFCRTIRPFLHGCNFRKFRKSSTYLPIPLSHAHASSINLLFSSLRTLIVTGILGPAFPGI